MDGVVIGTLCVVDTEVRHVSPAQIAGLADLADVVVALLQRRRDNRLGETARAELAEAHRQLLQARAFDQALLETLPVGVVAGDADQRVQLFNRASRIWHGSDVDSTLAPVDLPGSYDLFESDGLTLLPPERVPLVRVYAEERVEGVEIVIAPHGLPARVVSCSGATVRDPAGQLLGAVVAMADVTAQRELEGRLRTAALHDGLTGLPNRVLLTDRLTHALAATGRGGGSVAVFYCDLDGFKAVNDQHGHAAGDEVLIEAAARLLLAVRPGDTVARMGGDEFVLLCADVDNPVAAGAISRRITAAMNMPVHTTAGSHRVGISVGLALSSKNATADALLRGADQAMYTVKQARQEPRAGVSRLAPENS